MTRSQIRTFLKAGADALSMDFDSGRVSEFASKSDKKFPFAWVEDLKASSDFGGAANLIDDWDVIIHIAKPDAADSLPYQYEAIIDECDNLARKLIWQYNVILYDSTNVTTANQDLYKLLTLSSVNRDPFYKRYGNPVMSGIVLSFTLNSPDKTDVCP